jgi:hypothetical protein
MAPTDSTPSPETSLLEDDEDNAALYVLRYVMPAAFALLPGMMNSPEARAELLAIGLQESEFRHRRQIVGDPPRAVGPARGFWQFEEGGGIRGVLTHRRTRWHLQLALDELRYTGPFDTISEETLHVAVQHNDVLACVFARLNLWWLPGTLATRDLPQRGWRQYLEAWRPGKPHPETWDRNFARAWALVQP